jgi:flagellin
MLSIGTNTGAIMAQAAASSVTRDMETAMHRLSTGKRINAAADDAAGVAISSRLDSTVRGLNQSIRNALDAQALIDTAEGGMQETETILQRIRELSIQAANDTNSPDDRANLNAEAQSLLSEIDRISSSTTWAGQSLLDGTFTDKSFQVGTGTMAADQLVTSIADMSTTGLFDLTNPTLEKINDEFLINDTIIGGQRDPQVTRLDNGNFLVVWQGDTSTIYDVYGKIYSQNGNSIGSEFLINSSTRLRQESPSVTSLSDGGFFVTWSDQSNYAVGREIVGQRFDSDGNLSGVEIVINVDPAGDQRLPKVIELTDETLVVSWYFSASETYAAIYDKDGTLKFSDFLLSGSNNSTDVGFELTALQNGNFAAVWMSNRDNDQYEYNIFAQILDKNGNAIGHEFRVDTNSTFLDFNKRSPSISTLTDGGFVISYDSDKQFGVNSHQSDYQDGSYTGVYAKIYNQDGSLRVSEFQVNTTTENNQQTTRLAGMDDGSFVASWTSYNGNDFDLYAQQFSSLGEKIGLEFKINSYTNNNQLDVELSSLPGSKFVGVWTSTNQDYQYLNTNYYGEDFGIYGQIFGKPTISLLDSVSANSSVKILDKALNKINSERTSIGAISNRLDHIIEHNTDVATDVTNSLSRIQDADLAHETSMLASNQILQQSSSAMLAQANASIYEVLTLIPD